MRIKWFQKNFIDVSATLIHSNSMVRKTFWIPIKNVTCSRCGKVDVKNMKYWHGLINGRSGLLLFSASMFWKQVGMAMIPICPRCGLWFNLHSYDMLDVSNVSHDYIHLMPTDVVCTHVRFVDNCATDTSDVMHIYGTYDATVIRIRNVYETLEEAMQKYKRRYIHWRNL